MRRATFHRFNKFAMIRLHFPARGYALNTRSAQHFAEAPPSSKLCKISPGNNLSGKEKEAEFIIGGAKINENKGNTFIFSSFSFCLISSIRERERGGSSRNILWKFHLINLKNATV